jgi:fused signal recognition particle receptor
MVVQVCGSHGRIRRVLQEKVQADAARVFAGTERTRERLSIVDEILGYWSLDDAEDTLEELEEALLACDFGPETSGKLTEGLMERVRNGQVERGADLRSALRSDILAMLQKGGGSASAQLDLGDLESGETAAVLVVGVNGGGKTTSIGKLTNQLRGQGAGVMLAAGDTFRAAAYEQLQTWAERTGAKLSEWPETSEGDAVQVNSQGGGEGAAMHSPPAIMADACIRAKEDPDTNVLICDSSGRLHNNWELMEELAACKEAISGAMGPGAPQEVLLVLDGTTGMNMLAQAREFNETVGITGLVLTKVDGTARGGAVVGVVDTLGVPVKFLGVGEGLEDLQPFDPEKFVDALLPSA